MALTDDALVALIGVVADIHSDQLAASENEIEILIQALDILNHLGDDN